MPGPVLGTASLAGAAHCGGTQDGSERAGAAHARPQLTDAHKQYLSDALAASGVTLPHEPADTTDGAPKGVARPRLTQEQSGANV